MQGFPYEVQNHLLSPAELSYFHNLRGVVGSRALICPKIGLGDLFSVKMEDKGRFRAYRNKIDRKHVDFLLCDLPTMRPLVGIELDDSSHQRPDRQARDAFVNGVFAAARLPLLHVTAQRAYVATEIEAQLAPYFSGADTSGPAESAPDLAPVPNVFAPVAEQSSGAPRCPQCGSPMVLRTPRSSRNAGSAFWGCSNYPHCRGMIAHNAQPVQ